MVGAAVSEIGRAIVGFLSREVRSSLRLLAWVAALRFGCGQSTYFQQVTFSKCLQIEQSETLQQKAQDMSMIERSAAILKTIASMIGRDVRRSGTVRWITSPFAGLRIGLFIWLGAALLGAGIGQASQQIKDQYPASVLYQKPVEFIPNVWSAIGATAPPTYENSGHNNNLSFIVTGDGVVVVNAGATNALAKALHDEIKKITDEPVKLVINENGQGHAMLGNGYWADQGVPILAHVDAAKEFEERGADILDRMKQYNRDKAVDSRVQLPTETFEKSKSIEVGSYRIEVMNLGPAHSPGDIVVWLPKQALVIAGDMAFHERLLPIFEDTDTAAWLESWKNFEALGAKYVIPGHGHPTNIDQVRRYTRDYLVYLRDQIRKHLDKGGTLKDAYYVDQSPFARLDTFDELAKRNAGRVFEQMEFE